MDQTTPLQGSLNSVGRSGTINKGTQACSNKSCSHPLWPLAWLRGCLVFPALHRLPRHLVLSCCLQLKAFCRLRKYGTGNTGAIGTAGGIGAAEGGIVIIIAVIGMPTHGGFIQCRVGTVAASTGNASAVATGAEAGITVDACVITAVGPETKI